jgi:hypothetical protein
MIELKVYLHIEILREEFKADQRYSKMTCRDVVFDNSDYRIVRNGGTICKYMVNNKNTLHKIRGLNFNYVEVIGFIPDNEFLKEIYYRFSSSPPNILIRGKHDND